MAEYPDILYELLGDDDDEFDYSPAPSIVHFHNNDILPAAREIYIWDNIEEDTGAWFFKCVRWLERKSLDPIRVILATSGGDIAAMMEVHDTIRNTPCPIEIVATGDVCSAGVLILACGDRRLVAENASLMSHETQGGEGDLGFRASVNRMEFRKWQHMRWCELMSRYTPQDAKWWKLKTERQAEYWLLGGAEIVTAGLADEVIWIRSNDAPTGFTKRFTPFYAPIEETSNE